MRIKEPNAEERYEIVVKRVGEDSPIETNLMGDRETREILRIIGVLNLRNSWIAS